MIRLTWWYPSDMANSASGATDRLRNALNELERLDLRKACIARLRWAGRLTTDQIAACSARPGPPWGTTGVLPVLGWPSMQAGARRPSSMNRQLAVKRGSTAEET